MHSIDISPWLISRSSPLITYAIFAESLKQRNITFWSFCLFKMWKKTLKGRLLFPLDLKFYKFTAMFVFIEIPLKAETFPNEFIWQTFNISSKCHWSALNHILFSLSITLSILSLTQQVSVLHQNLFAFQEGNMSLERFSSTWSPALWILCGLECMDSFSDLTISFSVRILFSLKLFRLLWGLIFYLNYLQAITCITFYLFIP